MLMLTDRETWQFHYISNTDLMISHPAPTPHHAFTQHSDKWQCDIIMWHFVWWDVSDGIPPQGPRDKYTL